MNHRHNRVIPLRDRQNNVIPLFDRAGRLERVGRDVAGSVTEERGAGGASSLSPPVEQRVSIVITDPCGIIEYVNPRFCEVTGYSADEVIGERASLLESGETPAAEYERMWATVLAGKEWRGRFHSRKKGGELYWESASISPIFASDGRVAHLLTVKEEVAEHAPLEADVRRARETEAFGQLAGDVGHDLNDALTVVQANATLLRAAGISDPDRTELADEILQAISRATRLTRQLQIFSHGRLRDLDLNVVVAEMTETLRRIVGDPISLETRVVAGDATVRVELGMMEQVLATLAASSRDAMTDGGRLVIETSVVERPPDAVPSSVQAGSYVRLSVTATGRGIASAHPPQVLAPFFETKEVGKGIGLGLATVFKIVEQHRGAIEVKSELGGGTAFHVFLPRRSRGAAHAIELGPGGAP